MLFAFSPPPSPSSSLLSPPPNVSEFVQRRKKKRNNKNERNKKKEDKNKQKNAFFSVTHYFHGRTVDSPWVMGFFCAFFSVSLILSHHHPLHLPLPYTHTHTLSLLSSFYFQLSLFSKREFRFFSLSRYVSMKVCLRFFCVCLCATYACAYSLFISLASVFSPGFFFSRSPFFQNLHPGFNSPSTPLLSSFPPSHIQIVFPPLSLSPEVVTKHSLTNRILALPLHLLEAFVSLASPTPTRVQVRKHAVVLSRAAGALLL